MKFIEGLGHMALFEYSQEPNFQASFHFCCEDLMKK